MDRVVHHILSDCDIEFLKTGENVRIRIRETDPDIIQPTDFELEGDIRAIYTVFGQGMQILESICELDENKPAN